MKKDPILLVDSHHGIYSFKLLADEIKNGNIKVKNLEKLQPILNDLSSVDNEYYWDAAQDLEEKAVLIGRDGTEYIICQNEDIWAVPSDWSEEDFSNFII